MYKANDANNDPLKNICQAEQVHGFWQLHHQLNSLLVPRKVAKH